MQVGTNRDFSTLRPDRSKRLHYYRYGKFSGSLLFSDALPLPRTMRGEPSIPPDRLHIKSVSVVD
jgi:hypothetical protein